MPRPMICGVGQPGDVLAVEPDLAGARLDEAEDDLHGGGFAAGVAAEQADDLARAHLERQAEMDLDRAVECVDAVEAEQGLGHTVTGRGCSPPTWRWPR